MTKCDCKLRGKWARPKGHRRSPATIAALQLHFRKIGLPKDQLELLVNQEEAVDFFSAGIFLHGNDGLNFGFLGLPVILEKGLCHWYLQKKKVDGVAA